jgi:hypothetical protein
MSAHSSIGTAVGRETPGEFALDSLPLGADEEVLRPEPDGVSAAPGFNCNNSLTDRDLWLYRERTVSLLRRYFRISVEVGRLPSILGRELFRSKVTSYRMSSFEDAVIFVHDVENALDQLDNLSKKLIALIIFQDYSQDEAADLLRCARRTVCRQYPEALDQISELFLAGGLLNRLRGVAVENSCQEGEKVEFPANDCKQAE